jgi:hypothetical protein
MASKFSLDGSIVPRSEKRRVEERSEQRFEPESQTAMLEMRGRRHVVRLANQSDSGAMIIFSLIPHIGETIRLQLMGRGLVEGRVCWVRDGRIGVTFTAAVD